MGRIIEIFCEGKPVAWQRATPVMAGDVTLMKTPAETRGYQRVLQQLAILQNPRCLPLEGPLGLEVVATLARPRTVKRPHPWKQGTGDLDNYSKTAQDALNGILFVDDSQICSIVARKQYGKPSLFIRVWEIDEKEEEE